MPPSSIVVVGAGVTGLTVATLLQQEYPNSGITIIAAETPSTSLDNTASADYASMWAGAHYRPIHPLTTPQLQFEHKLGMYTAETMRRIARENPEAGVAEMPALEYFQKAPPEILRLKTGDVYAWPGDGFRVLEKDELPQDAEWGCEYQTYCVNVPVYSRGLMDRFVANGGNVIQHRLSSASEAFDFARENGVGRVALVVNCSGRNFDTDPKVKIIRGQTVLVKQQYYRTITWQSADGTWAFLIPRPNGGGTIVGGTKEIDDWEPTPRDETRERLLRRCVESFPDFVRTVEDFVILKDNVGRRPWREGGYRFEIEPIAPGKTIIHGYGAGGRGYELSWGAAGKILELVKEVVGGKAKL
jgi:D-amino-acid oxidase